MFSKLIDNHVELLVDPITIILKLKNLEEGTLQTPIPQHIWNSKIKPANRNQIIHYSNPPQVYKFKQKMKSKWIEDYIQFSQLVTESIDPINSIKLTPHFFFFLYFFLIGKKRFYIYIYIRLNKVHTIYRLLPKETGKQKKERSCCVVQSTLSSVGWGTQTYTFLKEKHFKFLVLCLNIMKHQCNLQNREQGAIKESQ